MNININTNVCTPDPINHGISMVSKSHLYFQSAHYPFIYTLSLNTQPNSFE